MPNPNISDDIRRELIAHLSEFVLERRLNILNTALNSRTRYLTVVLEDVFQSQNASAVLRTCECLGIQDIHIIENRNKFTVNPQIALGSPKWLTLKRYRSSKNSSLEAITALRSRGYRIVATSPHTHDASLHEFDLSKGKAAFIFGTELHGLSDVVMQNADEFVIVPTYGLTESLNLSVTVAICMHFLVHKLNNNNTDFLLSNLEKEEIMYEWLMASIKSSHSIEKRFLKSKNLAFAPKK